MPVPRPRRAALRLEGLEDRTALSTAAASPPAGVLYDFQDKSDAAQPWGSLTLAGGSLYGYTALGGDHNVGAIFTIRPDGTGYRVVHNFGGTIAGPPGAMVADGATPHHDALRVVGNELIGATVLGGTTGQGIIYAYDYVAGTYRIIHQFAGSAGDGAQPHSNPAQSTTTPGVLYGLTSEGGSGEGGTIYQVDLDGSNFKVLYSFVKHGVGGSDPHGAVTQSGNVLYGMTREGGKSDKNAKDGGGVVFSYDLASGYTVLHTFDPKEKTGDGYSPDHGNLLLVNGVLYGLTTEGGTKGRGTLFQVQLSGDTGVYQKLHDFSKKGGSGPHGSLTLGPDGRTMYGMTSNGGTADDGVVFSFVPGGAVRVLKSFQGPTGDGQDGLDNVVVDNGVLYGMTKLGGSVKSADPSSTTSDSSYQNGTVFALPLPSAASPAADPTGVGVTGRNATADFNADGVPDVADATGPGEAARVRVRDGATGAVLLDLAPFGDFAGGVFVAAGDIDGVGTAELVVTADAGGGPRVLVLSGAGFGTLADFYGIDDPAFRGGVRAAVGDVDGDGAADLVLTAGAGGGPRVAVFDGAALGRGVPARLVPDFFAFEPALRDGAHVALGDVNGDGLADFILTAGAGGGPRVRIADAAAALAAGAGPGPSDAGGVTADFFAGDPASRSGVTATVRDLDGDDYADLVVAASGDEATTTGYLGASLRFGKAVASPLDDPADGVFVA